MVQMNAKDSVSAKLAECYVTINGNRYNFMQAISLTATAKKNKTTVPILGRMSKGNKATSLEYTGKCKFHLNSSVFIKILEDFKNTGKDLYFDIQIVNEDPTSDAGRQEIWLRDCNVDGLTIASFDADGDYLTDEMDFTFEDWSLSESFKTLDGML